jgi:FMN phosphatase YigB (HAD superfamily)
MMLKKAAVLCTLTLAGNAMADVVVKETDQFKDVEAKVSELQKEGKSPLIVIDIDNTLLTSTSDIGGDIWYQWQRGKLDVKPQDGDKVDCLFQDSIGLLYELVPMKIIEDDVPSTVSNWQDSGLTVMALTSRSPNYRYATEREMARNQYDMTRTALKVKGEEELPIYIDNPKRPLSYINGIMMTTGMNKGTMLEYILDKTGQSFSDVVFIDDSKKNVVNMEKAYKDDASLDMTIFHYTKVESDRIAANGAVLTQAQADKMASDWKELNKVLDKVAPARIGDMCLGQ